MTDSRAGLGWSVPITDPDVRRRAGELADRLEQPADQPMLIDTERDRWRAWQLRCAAMGEPLPSVPGWAQRDPRLGRWEWLVVVAAGERAKGQAIVAITPSEIAARARAMPSEVERVRQAIGRLVQLGYAATGAGGTLLVRRPPVDLPPPVEVDEASDEALEAWVATLPEAERRVAEETLAASRARLRVDAGASTAASTEPSTRASTGGTW